MLVTGFAVSSILWIMFLALSGFIFPFRQQKTVCSVYHKTFGISKLAAIYSKLT